MTRISLLGLAVGAALLAQPAAALAQATLPRRPEPSQPPARSSALDAVLACRSQTDSAARLACYDAAAGRLDQAQTTGEVVVVDREQVQQARRSLFGFSLPSIDLFDRGPRSEADAVNAITSTLTGSSVGRDGHTTFHLADGSAWRQYGTEQVFARRNDPVRVERGMLGSFFIHIGNQPGVRAQRVQ